MESLDGKRYLNGEYVIVGIRNAFNDKVSFWISKKGYTVSFYCFSATMQKEVDYQLSIGWPGYINMFEDALKKI